MGEFVGVAAAGSEFWTQLGLCVIPGVTAGLTQFLTRKQPIYLGTLLRVLRPLVLCDVRVYVRAGGGRPRGNLVPQRIMGTTRCKASELRPCTLPGCKVRRKKTEPQRHRGNQREPQHSEKHMWLGTSPHKQIKTRRQAPPPGSHEGN